VIEPFWKTFHAAPRCPESYPQKRDGRSGSSHPKCCAGCPYPDVLCATPLDCGERCFLPKGHDGQCLCIGDENGEPDTCPA
jgi:hypothetical protein